MSGFLEVALAIHPRAWRERYADEVRGTLLDVADATGGKVPLAETLPLGFRGLWLRARGSVTFWAGLVVIVIQVASVTSLNPFYDIDGSLTSHLLKLNQGLAYSLPVIALASGWAAAMARIAGIARARDRLSRLVTDSWPLLAATVFGSAVALIVIVVRFGVPWYTNPGVLVALTQLGMVLVAIALGQMLGSVLPRVLVIFVAPAAAVTVGMLLFGWLTPLNAVPWSFYPGIAYQVDLRPIARIGIGAAVLIALAVLVVALRPIWARALPVLAVVTVAVVGAMGSTSVAAIATPVPRAESELVCSTAEPIVCLWPEQEAAFGSAYRQDMQAAYDSALKLGLPVDNPAPRSAARYSLTGISAIEGITADNLLTDFGLGTAGLTPDSAVSFYALSLTAGLAVEPEHGESEYLALSHSVAILLGVPADETWLVMEDPYTGTRLLDPADAPDEAAARALVERWLAEGLNGVSAPS